MDNKSYRPLNIEFGQHSPGITPENVDGGGIFISSSITHKSVEFFPTVLEMSIYENMLRDSIIIDLAIQDTLALQTILPIMGEESVSIAFRRNTGSEDTDKFSVYNNLRILSMEELQKVNSKTEGYILRFATEQYFKNQQTNIRQSFKPTPGNDNDSGLISTWVKQILETNLEFKHLNNRVLDIEPTGTPQQFVIPNMSPFETIRMLAKYADSQEFPTISDYVFYEDLDGFHFKTVQKIISEQQDKKDNAIAAFLQNNIGNLSQLNQSLLTNPIPKRTIEGWAKEIYYDKEQDLSEDIKTSKKSPYTGVAIDFLKIIDIRFNKVFNIETMIKSGFFDNKAMSINPLDMIFDKAQGIGAYQYHDDYQNFIPIHDTKTFNPISDENSLWKRKGGESHIRYIFDDPNHMNGGNLPTLPQVRKNFLQNSIASFAMLSNPTVTVTVPGDNQRRPGDVIELALAEYGYTDDVKTTTHRYLNGYYMVLSVRHHYNIQSGYVTVMELVKNSLFSALGGVENASPNLNGNETPDDIEALRSKPNIKRILGFTPGTIHA